MEASKPKTAAREAEQDSDAELKRKQAAADLMDALVDSFDGDMPRIPISIAYRIGALFVAIIMILIPIFYIGLVIGACYLVYYHAVEHVVIFKTWRHWYLAILVYVVPLLAGIILVVFMFKPLFARPLPRGKCRSLDKNKQPLLHEFVEHVCAVVGAPVPRQLDVDLQVNASAGFRRGMWSLFGNDLVLTIGLPLVAGLNVQQLAGVLAHEMGHFTQGAGLRLSYIVRSINEWLFRAVNEHDEWDDTLIAWSESSEYLGIIFALAMVFISITRLILFLLLIIAHGISCFQMRQMEYHADQYEIHLAGSKTFKTTSRRLTRLEIGAEIAWNQVATLSKLPEDLPALIVAEADEIAGPLVKKYEKLVSGRTRIFDTHPSVSDRIAQAERIDAPGIFRLKEPATLLFRNFKKLSSEASAKFYRKYGSSE